MITDRHCWPLMATDGHPWPLSRCAGTSDPYATLSSAGQIRRTRVIPKTLNPIWEEEIVMQGALAEFVGNAHGNGNGNGNAPLGIRSGLIVRVLDSRGSSPWKRFASMRTGEVARLVHLGYDVLHSDTDIVWLRDPTPYLMCTPAARAGEFGEGKRVPSHASRSRLATGDV